MLQRYYRLAGVCFRVQISKEWTWSDEGFLAQYAAQPGPWDHECVLHIVEELDPPLGEQCYKDPSTRVFQLPDAHLRYKGAVDGSLAGAYMRILRKGSRSDVQIKKSAIPYGITSRLVVSCLEAVHHITAAGGFLLHASWIRYRGKAVLFTGPSGIGKSTQAALWERLRGAELINGDRAAVFPTDQGVQVRGIPFCGSSGVNRNETMPLAAIVSLEQAKQTAISRLTGVKAFRQIWEGCSVNVWNAEDLQIATQSVMEVIGAVPVYHLGCTPDESAVLALEKEGVV